MPRIKKSELEKPSKYEITDRRHVYAFEKARENMNQLKKKSGKKIIFDEINDHIQLLKSKSNDFTADEVLESIKAKLEDLKYQPGNIYKSIIQKNIMDFVKAYAKKKNLLTKNNKLDIKQALKRLKKSDTLKLLPDYNIPYDMFFEYKKVINDMKEERKNKKLKNAKENFQRLNKYLEKKNKKKRINVDEVVNRMKQKMEINNKLLNPNTLKKGYQELKKLKKEPKSSNKKQSSNDKNDKK